MYSLKTSPPLTLTFVSITDYETLLIPSLSGLIFVKGKIRCHQSCCERVSGSQVNARAVPVAFEATVMMYPHSPRQFGADSNYHMHFFSYL